MRISMLEDPAEGWFIVTSDDLIFEVKGVIHPRDRIIAYVRYVPDNHIEKRRYRKIYDLDEREDYLRNNYPHYLWYSQSHGRLLQAVPKNLIKLYLNPVVYLHQMRKMKLKQQELAAATMNLSDILIESTDIKESDIGVTGSQLTDTATETSDIDLVVYGTRTCRKFYDRLKESFDKIPELLRYSGNLLETHVAFRWGEIIKQYSILGKIEKEKILQGIFGSYEFFIRLVKLPQEVKQGYDTIITKMRGMCEIDCEVTDLTNSIYTPCEYLVKSDEYPEIKKLISYRGRFTEQILSRGLVKIRGRLEDVSDTQTGERYQQVVLGGSSTDFLVPI